MTGEGSRTITLALIDAKLDTVLERLAEFRQEQNEQEERIRSLEQDNARNKERLGLVAGALAVLQIVGSGIAALVGANK